MKEEGARLEDGQEETKKRSGLVGSDLTDPVERGTKQKLDQETNGQLPTPSPSSNSTLSSAKPASSTSSVKRSSSQVWRGGERKTSRGVDQNGEDESKGSDGKEYQLCGMYFSHGITPKNPSISATTTSASTSTARRPRKSTSSQNAFSWRTIEPSTSTLLPPPIHYGLMLLGETPETYHKIDEESDEEEEDSDEEDGDEDGPECGFKLPYDILRDHYYAEDAVVRGKGNEDDEPEDVRDKREKSRKPAHYRPIQTSQSSQLSSSKRGTDSFRSIRLLRGSQTRQSRRRCRLYVQTSVEQGRAGLSRGMHQSVSFVFSVRDSGQLTDGSLSRTV